MLTIPDKILIAALTLLTFFSYSIAGNSTAGREILIETNGKTVGKYSLLKDSALQINGALGTSRITIKDGKVSFVSSPCRNKVCVHQGEIGKSGQMAACLPNRVVVRVTGGESEYDAVTR